MMIDGSGVNDVKTICRKRSTTKMMMPTIRYCRHMRYTKKAH